MAERRMFSKAVVMSDAFLDLPASARCLYFTLGMQADDDGFLNAPNSIIRMIGASPDDLRLLVGKGYLIQFDSGILALAHWRLHNCIQKDRYHPTVYHQERAQLELTEQKVYRKLVPGEEGFGSNLYTEVREGKESPAQDKLSEVREGETAPGAFVPPSLQEIGEYCQKRHSKVSPEDFYDYYASNGWQVGKGPMADWKAALRRWERNGVERKPREKPGDIHGSGALGEAELEAIRLALKWEEPE